MIDALACDATRIPIRRCGAASSPVGAARPTVEQMDVIAANQTSAGQGPATLCARGLTDGPVDVNTNGGAIAMGRPLGLSRARSVMTAANQLKRSGGRYALCTMCVGPGRGAALIPERV